MRRITSWLLVVASAVLLVIAIASFAGAHWLAELLVAGTLCATLANVFLQIGARMWSKDSDRGIGRIAAAVKRWVSIACIAILMILCTLFLARPVLIDNEDDQRLMVVVLAKELASCPSSQQTTYVDTYSLASTDRAVAYLRGHIACRKFAPWSDSMIEASCRKDYLRGAEIRTCTPEEGHLGIIGSEYLLYRVARVVWRTGDCSGAAIAIKPWRSWIPISEAGGVCFTAVEVTGRGG